MAFTMCTSGAIWFKAGTGQSAVLSGERFLQYSNEAEATINIVTRKDYVSSFSGLSANVSGILQGVCSDLAAIPAIAYDMSGFTSRIEAEDKINVLRDSALRGLSLLRDKKVTDFIDGA